MPVAIARPRAARPAAPQRCRDVTLLAVMEQRPPPGTELPEDQLAAQFSVSRTPVRKALQSLAGNDIVVLARNGGPRWRRPARGKPATCSRRAG